jgi:hypothetical protein
MRKNTRRHLPRRTFTVTVDGAFREHENPVQFAVNALGCNLFGMRQRQFAFFKQVGEKPHPALDVLGKLRGSRGSQAMHRAGLDAMQNGLRIERLPTEERR